MNTHTPIGVAFVRPRWEPPWMACLRLVSRLPLACILIWTTLHMMDRAAAGLTADEVVLLP